MIPGWLTFVTLRLPGDDRRDECDALRSLVSAQSDIIDELRSLLLEEKRVSRDCARFALEVAVPELEGIAAEMHASLADRVARAEEHTL
jgi:hypothetical protein